MVHAGPPPGVHMPGPSFLPFLASVGLGMLFLGLVFGEWLLAVGVVGFVLSIVGWMRAARQEYVKTVEADTTGHLEALPDPRPPRTLLTGLAILLVAAFVIQVGWIPPRAAGGETPSPGASGPPPGGGSGGGEPPASGEPPGSPGAGGGLELHAKGIAFVETSLTAPADQPFDLHYFNEDAGIPHDVAFRDASGAEVFKSEVITGVADAVVKVPPLAAGTYQYICTIHPDMTGTATVG
jgi:Cupredoxin-like domain